MARNIEKEYQKLTPEQAVLHRPASYIGSTNGTVTETWIPKNNKMKYKPVKYNPGLLKCFDELITNAFDASKRDKTVKNIKITILADNMSVWNDGELGIPIQIHKEHNVYLPELIFSHVHSSSNYDDTQTRTWAGTNGVGAKAAIIFSKESNITINHENQCYTQKFEDNLTKRGKPKIVKHKSNNSVGVTVFPDFSRFALKDFTSDQTIEMIYKRTLEVAALTDKKVSVSWNGDKLSVKNFESYTDMFLGNKTEIPRVIIQDGKWNICISHTTQDKFVQISSVNGCSTNEGGTHVDMVLNPLVKMLTEKLQSKHKDVTIRPQYIKDNIMIILNTEVRNPKFSSQTKEKLISKPSDFINKFYMNDLDFKKIEKLGLADNVLSVAMAKDTKNLTTGQRKKTRLNNIPKLDDANRAGGPYGSRCTIILTEGDSAKTMAISGLPNRDYYGVFPLRGKLLNTRDVAPLKLEKNAEIQAIVQILGLIWNKEYTTPKDLQSLRYGKILIMTDQDNDGFHIKGLLMNFIHQYWPSLLKIPGFVCAMLTPVIKATKGSQVKEFYNVSDYEKWKKGDRGNWKIKYYKGLATSNSKEAKEYFKNMNTLEYICSEKIDDDSIVKAFDKGLKSANKTSASDKRKKWIVNALKKPQDIDYKQKQVPTREFIDKELVLFSIADVFRSIPNIVDGLKTSQRKVLYSCFKRKLDKEIKVAQLSGYVSEHSAYHHGEQSLNMCIVGMAQKYVGHNNINYLVPSGQFGSRIKGGHDAGSPRYIFTALEKHTSKLFNPSDSVLLEYLDDDGLSIEPKYYIPIIPMILVNGTKGIGTGFSSDIPCFNPKDIIHNIGLLIKHGERATLKEMTPWYDGFKGTITKVSENKWMSHGVYNTYLNKVYITELPIGVWTEDYIELMKKLETDGEIQHFDNRSSEVDINIELTFGPARLKELIDTKKLDSLLNLKKSVNATNMHVLDENREIIKIAKPEDIITRFFTIRQKFYTKRKEWIQKQTTHELEVLNNKMKFIQEVSKGNIKLYGTKKSVTATYLEKNKYYKVKQCYQYLFDIKCEHFTEEKVIAIQNEIKKRQKILKDLLGKTPVNLWQEDLSDLSPLFK